jgi:hypothetical protein
MAKAKSREILETLQEQLMEISKLNDYRTDVDLVTFRLLTPDQVNRDVTLCLIPGDTPLTQMTNKQYTSGRDIQNLDGWLINLILYQKHSSDDSEESNGILLLEDFITDVINNLTQDVNIGLGLTYVHNVAIEMVMRYPYVLENLSMASMILNIKYDFDYTEA